MAEPRLTAEVLLGRAMGRERTWFYAYPEVELREVEWLHYGRYLDERMRGKPTQYITKKQEFYGREFRVTPEVLIPRPETELLVEKALGWAAGARVVDVGTGSGAIAVTLALESSGRVFACDLSEGALGVAAGNAEKLGAKVEFVRGDLLSVFADGSMDVVVSNPPYVAEADRESLQREVRDWEPAPALFAGPRGMAVYERLIPEAWHVLRRGGRLALEIGIGQAEAVTELAREWRGVEIFPDLAGIPRVLVCEKP